MNKTTDRTCASSLPHFFHVNFTILWMVPAPPTLAHRTTAAAAAAAASRYDSPVCAFFPIAVVEYRAKGPASDAPDFIRRDKRLDSLHQAGARVAIKVAVPLQKWGDCRRLADVLTA